MRKGFDGLSALVSQGLRQDPLSGVCYLFVNATRKRAKVLLWYGTGLCIFYKRLDHGTFKVPEPGVDGAASMEIDEGALEDLLDGIALEPRPKRLRKKISRTVVH